MGPVDVGGWWKKVLSSISEILMTEQGIIFALHIKEHKTDLTS